MSNESFAIFLLFVFLTAAFFARYLLSLFDTLFDRTEELRKGVCNQSKETLVSVVRLTLTYTAILQTLEKIVERRIHSNGEGPKWSEQVKDINTLLKKLGGVNLSLREYGIVLNDMGEIPRDRGDLENASDDYDFVTSYPEYRIAVLSLVECSYHGRREVSMLDCSMVIAQCRIALQEKGFVTEEVGEEVQEPS